MFFPNSIISKINTERSGSLVTFCDNEINEMIKFLKMVNCAYKLFTQNTIFENKDKTEAVRLKLNFNTLNSGKELPCD
jgi:hypothetical protein